MFNKQLNKINHRSLKYQEKRLPDDSVDINVNLRALTSTYLCMLAANSYLGDR